MRVGIVCRANVLDTFNSGIFTGIMGWIDYFQSENIGVDIITLNPKINAICYDKVNVYYPDTILSSGKHYVLYQFEDAFNFEWCLNFRDAIVRALSNHIYDVLICNEPESFFVCHQMGLSKYIKIVYYCHESGAFFRNNGTDFAYKQSYFELIDIIPNFEDTYFGVPSRLAKNDFNKGNNVMVLPYPCSQELLQFDLPDKQEGVLINGSIQDRKNFKLYVNTLARIREKYGVELLAKVLTDGNHIDKAAKIFDDFGYTNYLIKGELTGKPKYNFISSAKLGFYPSKQESFGLACFESLRFHRTVLFGENSWSNVFRDYKNAVFCSYANVDDVIWELYTYPQSDGLSDFESYKNDFDCSWNDFLRLPKTIMQTRKPTNRLYRYLVGHLNTWINYSDYMLSENPKGKIYLASDIEPVYKCSSYFQRYDTPKETFLAVGEPKNKPFGNSLQKVPESRQLKLF